MCSINICWIQTTITTISQQYLQCKLTMPWHFYQAWPIIVVVNSYFGSLWHELDNGKKNTTIGEITFTDCYILYHLVSTWKFRKLLFTFQLKAILKCSLQPYIKVEEKKKVNRRWSWRYQVGIRWWVLGEHHIWRKFGLCPVIYCTKTVVQTTVLIIISIFVFNM